DVTDVHLHAPSRRDAHFGLCLTSNTPLIDAQSHTHTAAHATTGRTITLPPLPPADAFGTSQDTLPQRVAGERQPAFHRLIRQELVARRGALAGLPGVSDMTLQAVIERIDAQRLSCLINQHLQREMPQRSPQTAERPPGGAVGVDCEPLETGI